MVLVTRPFTLPTPFTRSPNAQRVLISFVDESATVDARIGGVQSALRATATLGQLLAANGGIVIDGKAAQAGFTVESTGASVTVSGLEVVDE